MTRFFTISHCHEPKWMQTLTEDGTWQLSPAPTFTAQHCHSSCDYWLLHAESRLLVQEAWQMLTPFFVPSYGQWVGDPVPTLYEESGRVYAVLRLPKQYHNTAKELVNLYVYLTAQQPRWQLESSSNFREAYQQFLSALAAQDWQAAKSRLDIIQAQQLTNTQNIAFLTLRLRAAQQQWQAIWEDMNYPQWANAKPPAVIRHVLLTAFHRVVLQPQELHQDYLANVEKLSLHRARLGDLLSTRANLDEPHILRMFAYGYAQQGDLGSLARLLDLTSDAETRACIETLTAHTQTRQVRSLPEELALAMGMRDYDKAIELVERLGDSAKRAEVYLRAALEVEHVAWAQEGIRCYEMLDESVQQHRSLARDYRLVQDMLKSLVLPLEDWFAWFDLLVRDANDARLVQAIDDLNFSQKSLDWTSTHALATLTDQLLSLTDHVAHLRKPHVKRGLELFSNSLLSESAFPRPEGDTLYETLYTLFITHDPPSRETCAKMLRYAEALLIHDKSRVNAICKNLRTWFAEPASALNDTLLEAFELLSDYGVERAVLQDWYMAWSAKWREAPSNWQVWRDFLRWLGIEENALRRFDTPAATPRESSVDILAALPDGFKIAIFSLHPLSAERAATLLKQRHAGLDVRVYADSKMNDSMHAAARHADLVVVVTSCLSHTVFYGIKDKLQRDPVYPQSRGTTSILRAIENSVQTLETTGG